MNEQPKMNPDYKKGDGIDGIYLCPKCNGNLTTEYLTCPVCGWKEAEWVAPLADKLSKVFDKHPPVGWSKL